MEGGEETDEGGLPSFSDVCSFFGDYDTCHFLRRGTISYTFTFELPLPPADSAVSVGG